MQPIYPTLKAERLLLRPFTLADAQAVQELAGDEAIARTTKNVPHPYDDGIAESWISTHQQSFDKRGDLNLAVTDINTGSLIGCMSLLNVSFKGELAYWIGKPYWGKGYATESASAVVKHAFTSKEDGGMGLVRVHAGHLSSNPASGKVMKKLGMRHEGTQRKHIMKWGMLYDYEHYGILKEEWDELRSDTAV